MKIIKPFLLLTIFFLSTSLGHSQSFAVTTNLQVSSFSGYLEDYLAPGVTVATLLSTDDRTLYPVLLKIEISGQGYLIKSKPGLAGGKYLELIKNQPVTLTGLELSELFDPNKLDFMGLSINEFLYQGGRLPDGPVVISISAYDVALDKAVSNITSVVGTIQTNSPPQIIAPIGEQTPQNPQSLLISWIPQHMGNFATIYDIEVYEKNNDLSYDVIINSGAPLFNTSTTQTNYQYSNLDPLLIQGQEYLIRVRARDVADVAVFENQGWSEIEYFSYGIPGIAACYQMEASFCVAFCDYSPMTLVCEKDSYALGDQNGFSLQASLNNLGIGSFTVSETISGPDDYGYCQVTVFLTAEEMSDAPLALTFTSQSFSDHCLPADAGQDEDPGFYGPEGGPPNDLGNELSYDFLICADNPSEGSCEPPGNESLAVVADHPIMAEFTWGNVPDQNTSGFQVSYRLTGYSEWTMLEEISEDTLMAFIGDLEGGKVYETRVRSVCNEFNSDWSASIEFNTTCIIPNAVWVASKDYESAVIEWTGLDYATTYELKYRSLGATKWLSKSTLEPMILLTSLLPNTTYEYKLRVLCSETWAGFTPVYEFTTDRLCEGNSITDQTVSEITHHGAQLFWSDEAAVDTDQYSIRYRPVGETVWQVAFVTETSATLDFLLSNTWYQFSISRFCTDVWSDWSPLGSFRTLCGPPANTWVEEISPETAILNSTNEGVNRYEFSHRERFSDTWNVKSMIDSQLSLSQLLEDTEYEFRVRVLCDETSGWSGFSETRIFRTEVRCDPPGNFEMSELTPFAAAITWENAERPVKWGFYYRRTDGTPILETSLEGGIVGKVNSTMTPDGWVYQVCLNAELSIENLVPDKWYDFKIESWCEGFGWTENAEIHQFRTKANCKVPVDVSAVFVGIDTASVIWSDQLADQSYQIEIKEKDAISWTTHESNLPEYQFDDLISDIIYEYRIRTACDNFGFTDWTEVYEFRTDECLSPTQVAKEYLNTDGSILISWMPSAGENDYQLEYRLQDSLYPPEWAVVQTSGDYVELSDLQTNKIYEYRVAENCLSAGLFYNQAIDTFLIGRASLNNEYFECALQVQVFDPDNFYPLDFLHTGDSITAGDFGVLITQASGQIGNFSGKGYIPVPYFNRARVNVKFKNIKVNDEYELVDGNLSVTGVGMQVISEETAVLLDDIVSGLETLDDLLAEAEDILEIIDELLETLSAYLPADVVQNLEEAQIALTTAMASGNENDITAAQEALETANQNFQTAMTELLTRVLDIIIESLDQLNDEFSSQEEAIIADYETATGNLEEFEADQNGIYATSDFSGEEELSELQEVEWYEEDLTDQQEIIGSNNEDMNDLITLSQDYYEKVFAYGQMNSVQRLKAEVQTTTDLVPFMAALLNKDIDLLDYIGSEIVNEKTNEEIIPEVKARILEGIDKILKRL